jgi:hypothetical protein
LLRSPIAPAISAGYLPLALGFTGWQYPASIAFVTAVLAMSSLVYRRIFDQRITVAMPASGQKVSCVAVRMGDRFAWLPVFAGFLVLAYGLGAFSGMRLVLFPPLVVIAYEMFVHPATCPWATRPFALAAASTIGAGLGVAAVTMGGIGPISVVVSLILGAAILRVFRLNFPPVLAICLLPQVIAAPGFWFVEAVAMGSAALVVTFLVARVYPRLEGARRAS